MKVSSYVGTKSVGDVKINKDLDHTCDGKCVLIVEDIIDTGKTIKAVKQMFYNKGAKDVKIAKLETERDMYKKRLTEWKAEDNR